MSVLIHPVAAGKPSEIAKIQIGTGLRAIVTSRVVFLVTPSGKHPKMLDTPKPKKYSKPSYDWTPGPGGAAA